jgi:putative oxidoreductase
MTPAVTSDVMVARPPHGVASWLDRLGRVPVSLHLLLFRLGIASVFLKAGLTKIASWETTLALFRDEYRVPVLPPALAAPLATTIELACSTLLIVGLGTRLATLPLLGMILTIQLFVYPDAWSEHLVWGSILLFLLTRGPGAVSLDHVIARLWAGRRGGDAGRSPRPVSA